ncbi:MAG: anti-sigma factor [Solirubrobacterales bacterium]|nr:anti-sigma factor [Solirubrobacterales bacterium]
MPTDAQCGANAAAYALGALEPDAAEAFEHHLGRCDVCARELGGLQHIADTLEAALPQHEVPPGLRARVIGSVQAEARRSRGSITRMSRAPRPIGPGGRRAATALATALAVALVAAALAITMRVSAGSRGVRVLTANVVDSRGNAHVRLVDGRAELILRDFPPPPPGLIYEVWLGRPGRVPAATRVLFSVTAHGAGNIGVPAALSGVNEILVTPEPEGGSVTPTHRPVIVARLT